MSPVGHLQHCWGINSTQGGLKGHPGPQNIQLPPRRVQTPRILSLSGFWHSGSILAPRSHEIEREGDTKTSSPLPRAPVSLWGEGHLPGGAGAVLGGAVMLQGPEQLGGDAGDGGTGNPEVLHLQPA